MIVGHVANGGLEESIAARVVAREGLKPLHRKFRLSLEPGAERFLTRGNAFSALELTGPLECLLWIVAREVAADMGVGVRGNLCGIEGANEIGEAFWIVFGPAPLDIVEHAPKRLGVELREP